MIRDLFLDSLRLLILDIDPRGDLKEQIRYTQNKNIWMKLVKERI